MTVARLEAEMPNAEFVRWQVLLARRAERERLDARPTNATKRGGLR